MANLEDGMKSQQAGQCWHCDFFDVVTDLPKGTIRSGRCRRYPPQITSNGAFVLPVTQPQDWCGEFRESGLLLDEHLIDDEDDDL